MPFFFILPLWVLLLLLAIPLFFIRRLRFLGTHIAIASTTAVAMSLLLSTLILFGVPRLLGPFRHSGVVVISRHSGVVVISLYLLTIAGGGVAGLLVGVVLAHKLNRRFSWWPRPAAGA